MTSALFTLLSKNGKIVHTKKGDYKLHLKNLSDEQQWFTDRPSRLRGTLTAEQMVEGWKGYFADSSPNSVATFIGSGGSNKQVIFEQFKPKLKKNGEALVSKIKPLFNEGEDAITGFDLKRGESFKMKSPSIVVDDFTLSQITFKNNTKIPMKLLYTVGDLPPASGFMEKDLDAGTTEKLAGTYHGDWDLSVDIQAYSKSEYKWYTGLTVQADNPWYGHPQFEYNQSGSYMTSDDPPFTPPSWSTDDPGFTMSLTNGPGSDKDWNLTFNPT